MILLFKNFHIPSLILFLFLSVNSYAFSYTDASSAQELADEIEGVGITISNPVITHGANSQRGIFKDGDDLGLEIKDGIILTCMTVDESFTSNNSGSRSLKPSGNFTDSDLINIDPRARYNPIIFEFDVTLDDNTRLLLIDYQFASEEYNEYVGSVFNDTFGFFISGGDLDQTYNIARVIDNQTYVTIDTIDNYATVTVNNVNNGSAGGYADGTPWISTNSSYFIDNTSNTVNVEYDGLTHTLHATLDNLTPGETYHFKMALADAGDASWDTGVFINSINGLREPSICYDYAYKQNDVYLTEDYDPAKGPFISGTVVPNDPNQPIEVGMYIKNTKESEITATNVSVDIIEINTSQATYDSQSVWVTNPGEVFASHIDDSQLDIGTDYVNDININSFEAFEYFYTYFSLNPSVYTLELPIVARINYDLTIPLSENESITINRSSIIDEEVDICTNSGNKYDPVYGVFNIIENGLYTNNTNYFYNLNTQVVNRMANISVAFVDSNQTTNPNLHNLTTPGIYTVIGIDLLDLASYQTTVASCSEISNTLNNQRNWVILNNNSPLTPINTNNFFQNARENSTFRISYFKEFEDGGLLELEPVTNNGETRWNVLNFSDAVKLGSCQQDIDGNENNTDTVSQFCSNAGTSFNSAMTEDQVYDCMECVYGINMEIVCARDNFAIKPEALKIDINDQDQNGNGTITSLTNNGTTSPSTARIDLATGYRYDVNITATNHIDNNATNGYNTNLNDPATGKTSQFVWTPRTGQITTGCNDTSNLAINTRFFNGVSDSNVSINQVGDYLLSMLDSNWTSVDSVVQDHHISNSYFLQTADCVVSSSAVASISQFDHFNGCDISSTHTNVDNGLNYVDVNVSFIPYMFDVTAIVPSYGINNDDLNTSAGAPNFIYVSDMNTSAEESMSFHLNGAIRAVGFNSIVNSNFVNNCYAKDINITLQNDIAVGSTPNYNYRYHNDNNATMDLNGTLDSNVTNNFIVLTATNFGENQNGLVNTRLNLNFDRNASEAMNPRDVTFTDYNVTCVNPAQCTFNADNISNKTTSGALTMNPTITHIYGRTNAPNKVFEDDKGVAFIYYEAYCNGTDAYGNTCNMNMLPNGVSSVYINDPRWFVNTNHTANDGVVGDIIQRNATKVTTTNPPTFSNPTIVNLTYDKSSGFTYKATMDNNASAWLIYDRYNPNDIFNEFDVSFVKSNSSWGGVDDANSTSQTGGTSKTNRRIMW